MTGPMAWRAAGAGRAAGAEGPSAVAAVVMGAVMEGAYPAVAAEVVTQDGPVPAGLRSA